MLLWRQSEVKNHQLQTLSSVPSFTTLFILWDISYSTSQLSTKQSLATALLSRSQYVTQKGNLLFWQVKNMLGRGIISSTNPLGR